MIAKLLEREIVWSSVVQMLGKIVQLGLGYFTVHLLTQTLGAEQYGIYGKITEFSLFFSTAGNLGIFGNMVRKMSETPRDSKLFWNALLLRLWTAFFFFGLGLLMVFLFMDSSTFLLGTGLFMASLLLDYVTSVCEGALQADYRMGRGTLALLAGRAASLGLIFWLAHSGATTPSTFLLGPLLGSLLTSVLCLTFVRVRMKILSHWDAKIQKELLWTSLPFGIISLINSVYYRFLPSALIVKVLSDSDYSTYSLSLHLSSTLSIISTFFMFSVLPGFKHALKEGHTHTAQELYKKAHKVIFVLTLLVVGLGSLLGPYALTLVSDHNFLAPQLWFILPLLLVLTGVSYYYDLTFITLFGLGKDRWWLKREVLALSIGLSLSGLSLLTPSPELKIVLVISAAIAAEAAMAVMGLLEIKRTMYKFRK